jgi:hypothetical protein
VALDASGNVYAANLDDENSITIYSSNANGDAAPIGIIRGSKTPLAGPLGIAIR